jgi:hypothetical protein
MTAKVIKKNLLHPHHKVREGEVIRLYVKKKDGTTRPCKQGEAPTGADVRWDYFHVSSVTLGTSGLFHAKLQQ